VGCRLDQLVGVFRREMRCEQAHGGQMKPAIGQGGKQGRELTSCPRRLDALRCSVLGQAQLAHAVGMHGRVAGRDVEPTRVHLGDVSQERRGGHAIVGDERSQVAKEDLVTEVGQRVFAHEKTFSRGGSSRGPAPRPGTMGVFSYTTSDLGPRTGPQGALKGA